VAKKNATKPKDDQTLELRLPDQLYDEYVKLDAKLLESILQSMLGANKHVGITKVVVSPKTQAPGAAKKSFSKTCG